MKKIMLLLAIAGKLLFATEVSDFVNMDRCSKVIDKQLYEICYSYKYKGALAGWVKLQGNKVNAVNIKKRPRFYNEKNIPMQYRTKYKDYTGYGKKWNRGHIIVSDADFDYNQKALNKSYTMANIIPQSAKVNQKTWVKVEKYGRSVAYKLGYVNSVTIVDYRGATKTIGNDIVIPSGYYRILYNDEADFKKCFYYENVLDVNTRNDRLKNHVIECSDIRY